MTLTQINKAGLDELALDHVFTIGASGTDHYTFQGEGLNGTVNDPTLYLTRGKTYRFENGSGAHAIRIQSADDGTSGTLYNTGVTNNNTTGTVIVEVQHDAPDVLYYQCASHANMKGTIYVTGALADGGVTTAKIADSAVTTAKLATNSVTNAKIVDLDIGGSKIQTNAVDSRILANDAVATANIAANAVTSNEIANIAVTTAKLSNDSVTADKIAANAVGSSELANDSVGSNALANNAVDTAAIQDDAVTGAKIADDSITSAHLASNSVNTAELIDGAVNSAKLTDGTIVNGDVNGSAAISGTKIAPNFGSQNIVTTGELECDGEFKPMWFGHQSQCTENTYNSHVFWKVAEVSGSGGEGGQITFFGTNDYSGLGHNNQAVRTTLIIRCLTNNTLGGVYYSEGGGGYGSVDDIRWKYTGSNNIYEIWIKKGAYNNVVPHITGSFDYAKTFGTSTTTGNIPTGSTAFGKQWSLGDGSGSTIIGTTIPSAGVVFHGKRVFSQSGYAAMNTTYSFDIPCANDSGNGQWFWVAAGHTHYNHSYAAIRVSHFCARGTSIIDTHNYSNYTSGNGGNWTVNKPNNTTFRVTHNAGTYTYSGYYHVTVHTST